MLILRKLLPILASILYVISPVDVVPDFLPGFGWVDDLIVVGCLRVVSHEATGRAVPLGRLPRADAGLPAGALGRPASRGSRRRFRPDGPLRIAGGIAGSLRRRDQDRLQAGGVSLSPGQGRPPRKGIPGPRASEASRHPAGLRDPPGTSGVNPKPPGIRRGHPWADQSQTPCNGRRVYYTYLQRARRHPWHTLPRTSPDTDSATPHAWPPSSERWLGACPASGSV